MIYCEKLLQQFWERKSNTLLNQDSLCLPLSTVSAQQTIDESSSQKTADSTDILNALEREVVASAAHESSFTSDNLILLPPIDDAVQEDNDKTEKQEQKSDVS